MSGEDPSSRSTWSTFCLAAVLVLLAGAGTVRAEPSTGLIALFDERVGVARLLPQTQEFGEVAFVVDDAGTLRVELVSNIADLATAIDYPGAPGPVGPASVHTLGGWYRDFEVPEDPEGNCLFLPTACEWGFHYLYELPSQGPGEYTVSFTAPPGLGGEAEGAVIVRFHSDSAVAVGTMASPRRAHVGAAVILSAFAFEDDAAVTGATVTAHVWRPVDEKAPALDRPCRLGRLGGTRGTAGGFPAFLSSLPLGIFDPSAGLSLLPAAARA